MEKPRLMPMPPKAEEPPELLPPEESFLPKISLALVLAVLILIIIGAGGWLVYPYWQQLQTDLSNMRTQLGSAQQEQQKLAGQLQQAIALSAQHEQVLARQGDLAKQQIDFIARQEQSFSRQEQAIADARQSMARREQSLTQAMDEVRLLAGKPDKRWMVAEAEYLLDLAAQRLTLAHDPQTASAALQHARMRLQATGEPRWYPVVQQIERDLNQLSQVRIPDLQPLTAQLDQLKQQASQLPLAGPALQTAAPAASQDESQEASLDTLGDNLWNALKQSVRIQHRDQSVLALTTPEQGVLIRQNLELMLEGARLALVQRNQAMLQDSLQRARQWVSGQFDGQNAATQSWLANADQLAQQTLLPELPDISRALDMLRTEQALP